MCINLTGGDSRCAPATKPIMCESAAAARTHTQRISYCFMGELSGGRHRVTIAAAFYICERPFIIHLYDGFLYTRFFFII